MLAISLVAISHHRMKSRDLRPECRNIYCAFFLDIADGESSRPARLVEGRDGGNSVHVGEDSDGG